MSLFVSLLFCYIYIITSHSYTTEAPPIRNGIESIISKYPFLAAIRNIIEYDTKGNPLISETWCTGSLIRKEYPAAILTTSHCIYDQTYPYNLIVQLNSPTTHTQPILGISAWNTISIITHEQFDSHTLNNNIALLFIDTDLTDRTDLSISTIPSINNCCNITETLEMINYCNDYLTHSKITHTNLTDCNWHTNNTNFQSSYRQNNICGLTHQNKTCNGNNGAPLMIKNTMQQVGITSWSVNRPETLSILFTNTAVYGSWISDKLQSDIVDDLRWQYLKTEPTNEPTLEPTYIPTMEPTVLETINNMYSTTDVIIINNNRNFDGFKGVIIIISGCTMILIFVGTILYKTKKQNEWYKRVKSTTNYEIGSETENIGSETEMIERICTSTKLEINVNENV